MWAFVIFIVAVLSLQVVLNCYLLIIGNRNQNWALGLVFAIPVLVWGVWLLAKVA
jgi:hypothetical protein